MKTLNCEICGFEIGGETFDDWFKAMHEHWSAEHADVMKSMANNSKEEGEKWMTDAKAKFDAA